ncbi:hypothetical protein HDU82_004201 [Entophlyctis luteolus]|nr:hypothetical protein HDU82_004201 [Entophlyctis luteolus]
MAVFGVGVWVFLCSLSGLCASLCSRSDDCGNGATLTKSSYFPYQSEPGVSALCQLKGVDANLEGNLDDPAVAAVERLKAHFPDFDAKPVIGKTLKHTKSFLQAGEANVPETTAVVTTTSGAATSTAATTTAGTTATTAFTTTAKGPSTT